MVRACAFKLTPAHTPAILQKKLPFVGKFTAEVLHALVSTGTAEQLEDFQADRPVSNSRGELRQGTEGGATRRKFVKLPGVGAGVAYKWYQLGYREYEDLENAAREGGPLHPVTGDLPISREALYCLKYRSDLLEKVTADDVAEMRHEVDSVLTKVTGADGWNITLVGGGRRSHTSHDADFLVTHFGGHSMEGVVWQVYEELVKRGKLVSQDEGFCRIQSGRMEGYLATARGDVLAGRWVDRHQMDRYDHIWGVYITKGGARRRIDIMMIPQDSWAYAVVGWTGSKQYLRFMRTHAGNCNMFLNSHFLMRRVRMPGGGGIAVLRVPEEAPPVDANLKEFWPPGWAPLVTTGANTAGDLNEQGLTDAAEEAVNVKADKGAVVGSERQAKTEEDLFQLLGIPYREPHERDCP